MGASYYLQFSFLQFILRARMEDVNYNYWGEICVPIGLVVCFGVALLVWLRQELAAEPEYDFDEPIKESKKR